MITAAQRQRPAALTDKSSGRSRMSSIRNRITRGPSLSRFPRSGSPASKIGVAVAAALAGAAAGRAYAVDAAAAAAETGGGALQEVVVTARKREENLQTVPISIDVFTSKDVQNLGITSFDDYAAQGAVHLLHQHRTGHPDLLHARRLRRQQPELRQQLRDRILPRRQFAQLVRRAARPAPVRHRAHRGAQRSTGYDLRRRLHGWRGALHHQQA